jgi:hypothetical protein
MIHSAAEHNQANPLPTFNSIMDAEIAYDAAGQIASHLH